MFAVLALSWLRAAGHAIPTVRLFANSRDGRLCIWLLAWVTHALFGPSRLVDANINHPAPAQLTSAEQLLSSQIVFAPLLWLTHNAVLAANLTVFLSYPLAGLAMHRLLLALGCTSGVAFAGGLVFALGPQRVPANLPVLQYLNFYLPLVALALIRLRQRPSLPATAWLALAFAAGVLSAFYMAAILCVGGTVWGVMELMRRGPGRGRFAVLALAATGCALVLLMTAARPYLARPESALTDAAPVPVTGVLPFPVWHLWARYGWSYLRYYVWSSGWRYGFEHRMAALAGAGIVGLGVAVARGVAARGLVVFVLGVLLSMPVGPLRSLVTASPLRFIRYPWRFWTLTGFGAALLVAAALQAAQRLGRGAGVAIVTAACAFVLYTDGARLVEFGMDEVTAAGAAAAVYDDVARLTNEEGVLLELPLVAGGEQNVFAPGGYAAMLRRQLEPDAMVGSTRHWLPMVGGFAGYLPAQRAFVERAVARLPAGQALDDLVDMTHASWLLVHPPRDWPDPAVRAALLRLPDLRPLLKRDGWVLTRIERTPRHPEWYAAIAAGWRAGQSPLGTPMRPLPPDLAIAEVRAPHLLERVRGGSPLPLELEVRNAGAVAWPGGISSFGEWGLLSNEVPVDAPFTVRLVTQWRAADRPDDGPLPPARGIPLPRDVPPGETVVVRVRLAAPRKPGAYELEITVDQVEGAHFDAPGNAPLRVHLLVLDAAAPPG